MLLAGSPLRDTCIVPPCINIIDPSVESRRHISLQAPYSISWVSWENQLSVSFVMFIIMQGSCHIQAG